jgi:hypothetical protein
MRKTQAGLQRDKQDMQTALDALKADMAKKARTPGRFGSPMAPNGGDVSRLAYDLTDEEEERDGHDVMSARKQRADTSLQSASGQSLSAELSAADPTPEASPSKPAASGQAAAELDNLKSNLSRAHNQISLLKSRLLREKGLKSAEGKKSVDFSGEGVWLDEDLGDEVLDVKASPAPRSTSTPVRRGSKSGRSITRSSKGLTVVQQLNAAKTMPDSPQPAGRKVVDLTGDEPEGFGPLTDEPSMFNEDTDEQEEHGKVPHSLPEVEEEGSGSETERSTQTQRPDSMVSVEGMDPMFANVLKTPSASPAPAHDHVPFTPSPLRRASSITKSRNNRATRRTRGGAAFKRTRPPSVHGSKMGALAEELGFGGAEDISTLTQPDQTLEEEEYFDEEKEDVPKKSFVDAGVQYEAVEDAKPAPKPEPAAVPIAVPVAVPDEPVRGPTPEPEPEPEPVRVKETAEFGVQVEPPPPPPVPEIVKVDAFTQTTEKPSAETSTQTDPEPVVVLPVMVEMGTNTTEEWPVIPVPPKTVEVGTVTDPIPEPTPAVVAAVTRVPKLPGIKAPPTAYHDPALYSARTSTEGDSDTEYEDAKETVGATSRSQSTADFLSMHSPDEEDADGDGEERDSDDDSDAESIKVSRLHYKMPPPPPAAPPLPPPVEYATAGVQADAPKPEMAEIGTQTNEWVPPTPPALFRVGPQQQQFQFVTPAVAAAAATTSSSSPTQATHPPLPTMLGPSFQAAIARSRFNTAVTLPEQASAKDESGRPRVPSTPNGSPRVDRTRPPTMMLPPPPKLPPPPSLPSTLSPPKTAPMRPSSPPPAELVQRAQTPLQTPLQRTPVSSTHNLAVPSPGKSSVIRQAPSTSTSIRQAPSAGSFRSAGANVHHQSLNAAAMANGRNEEGSMVSSRRSTSSRRPSISSSISSEQHGVRPVGSPARTNTGLSSTNGNDQATDPNVIHAITQTMIGEFLYKYTHKAIGKGHAERRHKRFFWIHPYTKTIYWSSVDPGASNVHESSAKSGE